MQERRPRQEDSNPSRIGMAVTATAATALLLAANAYTGGWDTSQKLDKVPEPAMITEANGVDLLDGTWKYMNGVSETKAGLAVEHTGAAILSFADGEQPYGEGTRYVPNPPVNRIGTHLEMTDPGNVKVVAKVDEVKGGATLSFMSKPPVLYDERRTERAGVTVAVEDGKATVTVREDQDDSPETKVLNVARDKDTVEIAVTDENGETNIAVNGQEATFDKSVLDRTVWFGMDTPESFRVSWLEAFPRQGNRIKSVDMSKSGAFGKVTPQANEGLYGIAAANGQGDKLIGTAADPGVLMSNPEYTKFIIENFNEIQTEMIAKFQALQPERGKFTFNELDGFVAFAEHHDLEVHGHALVFNEANPSWLVEALENATPDEARAIMKEHITTVMTRYNGKNDHGEIKYWDVVNEPFSPENWGQLNENNIWHKAIGPSYIADAIRYAREANPNAIIGINDWAIETDRDRRAGVMELLRTLQTEGVLPDFIGMQTHIDEDTMSDPDAVRQLLGPTQQEIMREIASFGVSVRYSEVSVAEDGDGPKKVAVNAAIVRHCLIASNCIGVNWWGLANQTGDYFYFTGSFEDQNPGNDAPTTQKGNGPIQTGRVWEEIRKAASTN